MIVREFTVHMLHERANNERSRGNRVQVGLLIADILSPHRRVYRGWREREKEKKKEKFFFLECTIALRLTVCSPSGEARSLSRLVIFSSAERREARGFLLVARDKKDLGILGPGVTDIPTGVILLYLNWASVPYAHIYGSTSRVYASTWASKRRRVRATGKPTPRESPFDFSFFLRLRMNTFVCHRGWSIRSPEVGRVCG